MVRQLAAAFLLQAVPRDRCCTRQAKLSRRKSGSKLLKVHGVKCNERYL